MSRTAIVYLRDGRAYEGDTTINAGWVHLDGQRRLKIDGEVSYRPAGERTWPQASIAEIRWNQETR